MTLKNGKYSIKALQLGYLAAKMEKEDNTNRCPLCWENGCKDHSMDIKNDPFISTSFEEYHTYA